MCAMKTVGMLMVWMTLTSSTMAQLMSAIFDGGKRSGRREGGEGVIQPLGIDLSPIFDFQSLYIDQLAPEMTKIQDDLSNSMQGINEELSQKGDALADHIKRINNRKSNNADGDGDGVQPKFYSVVSESHTTNVDGEPTGEANTVINVNGKISKYHDKAPQYVL